MCLPRRSIAVDVIRLVVLVKVVVTVCALVESLLVPRGHWPAMLIKLVVGNLPNVLLLMICYAHAVT